MPEELGGGSVSGNGPGRPRPRGRRVRRPRRARARCSRATSWPPPWPAPAPPSSRREILPAIVAGDVVATWAFTEPPPHDGLGDVAAARRGRRRRLRAHRREVTGRGGRRGRPAARHRDAPTPASPSSSLPADTPGVTVTPLRSVDLVRRFARIQFDGVRVPAGAVVGEVGGAAADVERQLQIAGVVQSAEMVGAAAGRVRLHPRLGVQPLLLRPSAGVVPGDQAPLRRHEDVARGQPRARRRRGRGTHERDDAAGAGGQRGQGLHRRLPRRARRRTACRCTAASASPTSTTSTCTCAAITVDRLTYGTPDRAPPADRRAPARTPPDREPRGTTMTHHDRHRRSRASRTSGSRARAWLAENFPPDRGPTPMLLRAAATDEEELAEIARARELQRMLFDGGLRRHLLPEGVRRPRAHPRRTSARSTRRRAGYAIPRILQVADVRALRGGAARVRHRGAEAAAHPRHPQGRGDLDAVPLRAERRLRRRRRAHHRGARRRRVGRQRLEDLDHGRVVLRLRPVPAAHQLGRAQAPRPHACSSSRSTSPASSCTGSR